MDCILQLSDGRVFNGRGFGAQGVAVGEVVFNTSMTGYQEVLTDPSYCGQMVCMTQPLIGNYGVNSEDSESRDGQIWPVGFIAREVTQNYSNHRARNSLDAFLREQNVVGLHQIDTRALTRHIRQHGAMVGAIAPADADRSELAAQIETWGTMDGRELIGEVSCREPYTVPAEGGERFTVAAYDFGAKRSIFDNMARLGITARVFPHNAAPSDLLADDPDGLFLSNGPGDPAACGTAIDHVRELLGQKPMFGICLGHQLLSLTLGLPAFKLPFGHHGGNHPVRNIATGAVEITSQNHNFCVADDSVAGVEITHINLNDKTVEGIRSLEVPAFSVQYHPEAAPGPHDSRYLFDSFERLMTEVNGQPQGGQG